MVKCWKCNRKGLFLKLRYDGLCKYCVEDENRSICEKNQKLEQQKKDELKSRELQIKNEKIASFRLEFPLNSTNNAIAFLQHWKYFNQDDQIIRQKRALHQCVPIAINSKDCNGIFVSHLNNKIYNTDFYCCSCPDYVNRKQPCKHMYRLFYEISTSNTNNSIINIDISLLDAFDNTSNDAKDEFFKYCRWYRSGGIDCYCNDGIKELISAGIFQKNPPFSYVRLLGKLTKDELILALAKRNIAGYRPSWSKVKIINWVCETQPKFLEKYFSNYANITPSVPYREWIEGIKKSFDSYEVAYEYWL